ncbi:MAG: hypothetical protein FGM46_02220 [Ferruginibacter sp.]|nr:hypothetical protein [Ferruginibacter sp.]
MQTEPVPQKTCLSCSKQLRGRTDKKFCNDYCRNTFNNQLKAPANNLIRTINHILCKNRRILDSFMYNGEEMIRVKKEKLIEQGFLFKYATHININKKGSIYFFYYDYGLLSIDEETCIVIKKRN